MTAWWIVAVAGVVGGVVAAGATTLYQAVAAPLFAQGGSNDEPSNVQAADSASRAVAGRPVTQKHRQPAGSVVHYATGVGLGLLYAVLVEYWPPAAIGFGAAFGVAVALLLDDMLVPAFGWGPWPWNTPPATHGYSLTTHIVFGVVLEAVRRGALALLG